MDEAKRQVLGWEDVHDAAGELFNVWMSSADVRWAKEGWALLTRAGLAQYDSKLGRCRAAVYLLALATLYRDFCLLAWDVDAPLELPWGADLLQLSPLRVGQLVGVGDSAVDEAGNEEALAYALQRLVAAARLHVLDVLFKGYGSATGLFAALGRSSEPGYPSFLQMQLFEESRAEPGEGRTDNDDIGWGNLRVYEWLAEGDKGIAAFTDIPIDPNQHKGDNDERVHTES